jgi:hypothetical protein
MLCVNLIPEDPLSEVLPPWVTWDPMHSYLERGTLRLQHLQRQLLSGEPLVPLRQRPLRRLQLLRLPPQLRARTQHPRLHLARGGGGGSQLQWGTHHSVVSAPAAIYEP